MKPPSSKPSRRPRRARAILAAIAIAVLPFFGVYTQPDVAVEITEALVSILSLEDVPDE